MEHEYVLVFTPYITRKGVRIWASQYGLKAFCLRIPREKYRGGPESKNLLRRRFLLFCILNGRNEP